MPTEAETIIAATQLWLAKAGIGLNLCQFAKDVHIKKQTRYAVSTATTPEALLEELLNELRMPQDADPEKIDTMLHLLREASVDRAVDALPHADKIFGNNVGTRNELGRGGWKRLGL